MINKNITSVIADNIQDKEVNDENIYSNAAVEAQKYLEEHNVIDSEEGSTNEPVERQMTEP